jgi:hypothetical protein
VSGYRGGVLGYRDGGLSEYWVLLEVPTSDTGIPRSLLATNH